MILFKTKAIWWPTWQGWTLFSILSVAFLIAIVLNVHRFLAVTERVVNADVLVVEEWVPEVVARAAVKEFMEGRYRLLMVSGLGASVSNKDRPKTSRSAVTVGFMESLGIPRDQIVICLAPETGEHRSYAMALATRDALRQQGIRTNGVNIIAPAAHARKTWLVYRRALASEVPVGIIAVLTEDYDPARWWLSSDGAKWVVANGVGWLHEWVFGARS